MDGDGDQRTARGPAEGARRPGPRWDPVLVRWCALAALPILAAAAAAIAGGWVPVGDSATLALRTGDVVRADPPLVGMPSTSNTITDADLAHPGPLEVWVAAPLYALVGPVALVLVVTAANVAATTAAVWVGWRRGGPVLAGATTAVIVVLCWALGATVIRDPLNSHLQLLPWFALVLLCWDIRLGRWRSIPLAVLAGAWVTQAHVLYLPLVGILGAGTAVGCWLDDRRRPPDRRQHAAAGRRRSLLAGVAVGVVTSLPMLVDQVWGSGNLANLIRFSDQDGQGWGRAISVLVGGFGFPPAFARPGTDPLALLRAPTNADLAAFALGCAAVAAVWVDATRRGDRPVRTLLVTTLWSVAGVVVAVARTPAAGAVLAADPMLVWKPVTGACWLAVGWGTWRGFAARRHPSTSASPTQLVALRVGGLLAAVAVVTATVLAPPRFGGFGEGLMAPAGDLRSAAVDAVDGEAMVQVNASGWAARLYLRHTVIEGLERHGIATRTTDDGRVFRRDGTDRPPATATLWVVSGDGPPSPPAPGARLVATVELVDGGSTSPAAARRRALRERIDAAGTVTLRDDARISLDDLRAEYFRWDRSDDPSDRTLPAEWITIDAFVDLHRNGLIASPAIDGDLVAQVYEDGLGRYFAAEDTVAWLYWRDEPAAP